MTDDSVFEGIHPGWRAFLDEKRDQSLRDLADVALEVAARAQSPPQPRAELVFEFLRYSGPDEITTVVLGQDPYPEGAMGICFSAHSDRLKPSLRTVYENLARHDLLADAEGNRCDIRSWAAQGVLMMNAALTTDTGKRRAHRAIWQPFTQAFLEALSARADENGRKLVFLLWGNDAKKLGSRTAAAHGHHVLEWTHPSPMCNNRLPAERRFESSPHFVETNQILEKSGRRPICWDPCTPTLAFTDGGCDRNGRSDAKASLGVWIASGPAGGVSLTGLVPRMQVELVDPADPARGFRETAAPATPTNNRGEYTAWCWALLAILRSRARGPVEIISDCRLFIQTMLEWLPARRKKGTETELKNYDLVAVGSSLLEALRAQASEVTLTHTRSHRRRPSPDAPHRERLVWEGNDKADRLATISLTVGPPEGTLVIESDPALRWLFA